MHRFLVRHGIKWAENANFWLKITKNACVGPNLFIFGPKILIFMRGSKSFDTHIMKKTPRHLIHIVFWSATGSKEPKNSNIWRKKPISGHIWPFLGQKSFFFLRGGEDKTFGIFISGIQCIAMRHLFRVETLTSGAPIGR